MTDSNRILPTTPKGWLTLGGAALGVATWISGTIVASHAWLVGTIEQVHTELQAVDNRREQLLMDITLLDKALENMPEGDDRDAMAARRLELYAELDRLGD